MSLAPRTSLTPSVAFTEASAAGAVGGALAEVAVDAGAGKTNAWRQRSVLLLGPEVVGEATDSRDAIHKAIEGRPDVATWSARCSRPEPGATGNPNWFQRSV